MQFKKRDWTPAAAAALAAALSADLLTIKKEVEQGVSELWEIPCHGYLITRLEETEKGRELVLVAGQGRNFAAVVRYLQRIALKISATMRIHSSRVGMARILAPLDFAPAETVFTWQPAAEETP